MSDLAAWIQAISALAACGVTVVLAVLTYRYVDLTRDLVSQGIRRDAPLLIGRLEPFGVLYGRFVLTNVGLAPAVDVYLRLAVGPHSVVWRHQILEPGRSEFFMLPRANVNHIEQLEQLAAAGAVLTAEIACSDRDGTRRDFSSPEIRLKDVFENWTRSGWCEAPATLHDLKESIERGFKELTDALRDQAR